MGLQDPALQGVVKAETLLHLMSNRHVQAHGIQVQHMSGIRAMPYSDSQWLNSRVLEWCGPDSSAPSYLEEALCSHELGSRDVQL